MSLFAITPEGDLDRGPNGTGFFRVRSIDKMQVHLATRARLIRGEVKRNQDVGLDLFWAVQPDTPDEHVAGHLASLYSGTPGVTDVLLNFSFDPESGVFATKAQVEYTDDDLRERQVEHEGFQLNASSFIGGPSRA